VSNETFINGVWAATLTPLDNDLGIDTERLIRHAFWLLDSGVHGIGLFGTTGEAVSFSVDERVKALDALLTAGIRQDQLLVGAGCCALTDSIALAKHAVDAGCFNVLMLPPFYYKDMSDEGLAASFGEVIDRVNDPLMNVYLYHFPRLSGVPITAGLLDIVSQRYKGVVAGVKDSGGDYTNTQMMIERYPDLHIFPGSERFLHQAMIEGGAGCITATANANPRGIRDVWDAWERADADDAAARQTRATEIRSIVEKYPLVTGQKHLVAAHRKDPGWTRVRPPMTSISTTDGDALAAELQAADFSLTG